MSSCVVGKKKEVFGKEIWKGLSGTNSSSQKVCFFVAIYTERCVQRDLFKGMSQIRLENMISSL